MVWAHYFAAHWILDQSDAATLELCNRKNLNWNYNPLRYYSRSKLSRTWSLKLFPCSLLNLCSQIRQSWLDTTLCSAVADEWCSPVGVKVYLSAPQTEARVCVCVSDFVSVSVTLTHSRVGTMWHHSCGVKGRCYDKTVTITTCSHLLFVCVCVVRFNTAEVCFQLESRLTV